MVGKGLVTEWLLRFLLSECKSADRINHVIDLMVKYGLVVALQETALGCCDLRGPCSSPPAQGKCRCPKEWRVSFGFVFIIDEFFEPSLFVSEDFCMNGFLPGGFYQRLIARLIGHSGLRLSDSIEEAFQSYALLSFASQRFRITLLSHLNMIRVQAEGSGQVSPLAIYHHLCDNINFVIQESMKSLKYITLLPFLDTVDEQMSLEDENPYQYLHLLRFQAICNSHNIRDTKMTAAQIESLYGCWLDDSKSFELYDTFISYRWGAENSAFTLKDAAFTIKLYNAFWMHTIGRDYRSVKVFLDRKRLQEGNQLHSTFSRALIRSVVFVPIVSSYAISTMLSHNPAWKDNVLLEWIVALLCIRKYTKIAASACEQLYQCFLEPLPTRIC